MCQAELGVVFIDRPELPSKVAQGTCDQSGVETPLVGQEHSLPNIVKCSVLNTNLAEIEYHY